MDLLQILQILTVCKQKSFWLFLVWIRIQY